MEDILQLEPPKPSFMQVLEGLCGVPGRIRPLRACDIKVDEIRAALVAAGLDMQKVTPEVLASLHEPQFRTLKSGRGVGVVALLGEKRAGELLSWIRDVSCGGQRIKSSKTGQVIEGTEGRGLRQLMVDIIELAVDPVPSVVKVEEFCRRTNQRVWKGHIGYYGKRTFFDNSTSVILVNTAFRNANVEKPIKELSSVVPHSAISLWHRLCQPIRTEPSIS